MLKRKKIKVPGAVDVFFFLGAALISAGAGLWCGLPVGLMTAGAFSLAAAWLAEKPDGEGGEKKQ